MNMKNYENELNKYSNENEEQNYEFNPFNSNVEFDNKNIIEYDVKYDDDIPTFKVNKQKIGNVLYDEDENNYDNKHDNDYNNKNSEVNIKKRERLVNLIINLYKKIKELTYQLSTINENKLLNWQAKGKINSEILTYEIFENENGEPVTILDLINEFDTNLKISLDIDENNVCNLDKDFENALRNDLIDIFNKKNIGLSAEADLFILLFQDMLKNIGFIVTSRITLNTIIKQTSEKLGYKMNNITTDELNYDTLYKEKTEVTNNFNELYNRENITMNNNNINTNNKLNVDNNKNKGKNNKKSNKRGRPRKNKTTSLKEKNNENNQNEIEEITDNNENNLNEIEEVTDKNEIKKINNVLD